MVTYTKAAIAGGMFWITTGVVPSGATEFSAGTVMSEMSAADRFTFIAGVVEGLAIARYMADDKAPDGMSCIYNWLYEDQGGVMTNIEQAFNEFPDYPPGAVVLLMVQKECP